MKKSSEFVRLTRRELLSGTVAAGTLVAGHNALSRIAHALPSPLVLEAKPGRALLQEEVEGHTPIWGYDGRVPGPVIRVKRGADVHAILKNSLPEPTTIHWHGIRIDNAMDGVANMTQKPVEPGQDFEYKFKVPDAGTYWYHPHNRTWEQLARGLYGVLIVEEETPPHVDQDLLMVADDWRLNESGAIDEKSFGAIHDRAHAGRLGNILTINGRPHETFKVRSGERIRLRVLNTSNARILRFRFEELEPYLVALDGQPVPTEELKHGLLTVAPAQRADLIIDMTGSVGSRRAITEVSSRRLEAAVFDYVGEVQKTKTRGIPELEPNNLKAPNVASARMVELKMTGGAMSHVQQMEFKGQSTPMRELVRQHGMVWGFNGHAGMSRVPLFKARNGETIGVRIVNETRWPHAMHFHGHHFREGSANAPWRDTLLMEANETRTVYMIADNPGKWMLHCHMLEHQAGGMATWFEVSA